MRAWSSDLKLGQQKLIHWRAVESLRQARRVDSVEALREVIQRAIDAAWPKQATAPHERRKRAVIEGHYLQGQPIKTLADALHVDERTVRRILTQALDDLAQALSEIDRQVEAETPHAPAKIWVNLAPPLALHPLMIGREALLAQLIDALAPPTKLCALTGLPGSGKTALLTHVAHHPLIRQRFPDGVLWAQCEQGTSPAIKLRQWGAALGISQSDLDRLSSDAALLSGVIHSLLQDRAVLIVLEDVFSPEDAQQMLLGGARCCHVVSSPFADTALRLKPDHHFQIPPLTPEQSRTLIEHIAPEIAQYSRALENELVTWSSGLPLALELLGQYLRRALRSGQPRRIEAAIAQLLETRSRLELLSDRSQAGLSGLSKAIRATIAQLPRKQQRALHRLAALPPAPAAFDEATMLAMVQGSVVHLDALADLGLVQCVNGTYSIHPVLRDVVLADSSAAEEHRAGQVQAAQLAQSIVETGDGLSQLSPSDWALVLAGAQAAVELGLSEVARALSLRLLPSLLIYGLLQLADALLTTAQARPNSVADSIRLKAYHARVLTRLGKMQDARACADQAVAMAEEACPALLPQALAAQAWVRSAGGDPIGALDSCARAKMFDIPEPRLVLELERIEGAALVNSGRYAEARTVFQEALELARELQATEEETTLAIALGVVGRQQRRYDEAETWLTRGLSLARSLGASEPTVLALIVLGIIANERDQRQQAAAYFAEAEPLALRLGLPWPLLQLRHAQGVLCMRLKQWAQAEHMLRDALQLAQSIQWHLWVSNVSIELGECLLATGQLDEANRVCAAALAHAREGGHNSLAALLRYVLARAARERGDIETARHLAKSAAAQLRSSGHYRADEVTAWLAGLDEADELAAAAP